jgi:hypothetical protein
MCPKPASPPGGRLPKKSGPHGFQKEVRQSSPPPTWPTSRLLRLGRRLQLFPPPGHTCWAGFPWPLWSLAQYLFAVLTRTPTSPLHRRSPTPLPTPAPPATLGLDPLAAHRLLARDAQEPTLARDDGSACLDRPLPPPPPGPKPPATAPSPPPPPPSAPFVDDTSQPPYINAHNRKRYLHCNTPNTVRDTAHEARAQAWADTCPTGHSPAGTDFRRGMQPQLDLGRRLATCRLRWHTQLPFDCR